MIRDEILLELRSLQDIPYRDFQRKLIPTLAPEKFLGVRTPELRRLSKQLSRREDISCFLEELPHRFFDENQLHAFLLAEIGDYDDCLEKVERFLPFIDNWATCDQLSPKVFKKHRRELLDPIRRWLESPETYTKRFGIGMLMQHYMDKDFDPAYPEMAAAVRSEEYYVRMMQAWYFATALAKQYSAVLPYLEERRLAPWTHNKAIRKALESFRIDSERKEYLRTLRLHG